MLSPKRGMPRAIDLRRASGRHAKEGRGRVPVHGGAAAGRPTRASRWRVVATTVALALSGCGGYSQTTSMGALVQGGAPGSIPEDLKPVDSSTAQILEHGAAGDRLQYRSADGRQLSLALGPTYTSARGVPCRLGRLGRIDAGPATPTSFPFCRLESGWYEVTPVVISGY
jgi:hypothetical protein